MEVNYKYCKRCETKVSLNATQCLVCNGREFATQEEVNQAAEALLNYISAQQSVQRIGLWARIKKWFGAIANR